MSFAAIAIATSVVTTGVNLINAKKQRDAAKNAANQQRAIQQQLIDKMTPLPVASLRPAQTRSISTAAGTGLPATTRSIGYAKGTGLPIKEMR